MGRTTDAGTMDKDQVDGVVVVVAAMGSSTISIIKYVPLVYDTIIVPRLCRRCDAVGTVCVVTVHGASRLKMLRAVLPRGARQP